MKMEVKNLLKLHNSNLAPQSMFYLNILIILDLERECIFFSNSWISWPLAFMFQDRDEEVPFR
jgi:hypothetical protein